uniref:Uncharacterized protein n=1 Tax=Anopheles atroparvus TaxID=41427 RepID=A0A182IVS3_ANOAO
MFDDEQVERKRQRRRQSYVDLRAAERAVRVVKDRTRRLWQRHYTTESTGQLEPEQEPEQGPTAEPSMEPEPPVLPRSASTSVTARSPVLVDKKAGLGADRFNLLRLRGRTWDVVF